MPRRLVPDRALRPALEALAARDADIARHYAVCGLPPVRRRPLGFAGLLHIILAQQISAQSAAAAIARLQAAAKPLTPERFLGFDDAALRAIGFSRQKMGYGRALAEDVIAGRVDFRAVRRMEDEEAIAHLIQAKGVGRWSAEIYLLFALRRPDVCPADDLAVQVGAQRLRGLADRPRGEAMRALAEPWRPFRSAAAQFLWHIYSHPGLPEAEA